MYNFLTNLISIYPQINKFNIKLQHLTNLPVFNTIYMGKESGKYIYKRTLNP